METSPGSKRLKTDRIAKADRVSWRGSGKTEAAMKVELLMRRRLVCRAKVDHVLRTAALGKSAGVFDVSVSGRRKLPVEIDASLAGQIPPRSLGWPHKGEHSSGRPGLGQRSGPGQLDAGIITMT